MIKKFWSHLGDLGFALFGLIALLSVYSFGLIPFGLVAFSLIVIWTYMQ